ncbi:hypothetical protein [Sphingomonas cavernae]|uniref:hypothetical protein n=1 Tax=Sphingomonas cavernae TaxID=2320861 RepID=UPI0011C34D19|nr:hypothetical protein [Sphingomonas cavernae]
MSYDPRQLNGVAGWLALLVFVLGVVTPIIIIGRTAQDLYGDPGVEALRPGVAEHSHRDIGALASRAGIADR